MIMNLVNLSKILCKNYLKNFVLCKDDSANQMFNHQNFPDLY